jgi:hypothetical protein
MRGKERCEPGAAGPVVWCRHTRGTHGNGPTQGLGAKGTRGERTWNMPLMFVTLEVSKLSGWLKAHACCRVEGRACDAGEGEVRAAREAGERVKAAATACTRGPTQGLGAKGTRGERT